MLNYGPPTLLNTPSRFSKLTFDQLFLYYDMKGIKLREDTFEDNLELRISAGRVNMLAQLLSDDPHIDIQFALFNGKSKEAAMYAVRNFGHMCLLVSLDKVLDYGDTINIPQADERYRRVERKEVMLFDQGAFREAVINAFVHNAWVDGNAPMFTAYQDRIEIESIGTLPPKQTKEGFFRGQSIPVNLKLSGIFVQLHISEKSGRGVPRIVGTYGRDVFEFTDSSIIVTIPFNRLDLGDTSQVTPQVISTKNETITGKILSYCSEAKSLQEILAHLGLKDRKNLMTYIRGLVESGRLARTIPDKPNSRNQKYITIK